MTQVGQVYGNLTMFQKLTEYPFYDFLSKLLFHQECLDLVDYGRYNGKLLGASYVTKSSLDKIYPMRDSKNGCKNCRQLAALATRV